MKLAVNVAEAFVCDVSIDLSAGYTSMAQKLLNSP